MAKTYRRVANKLLRRVVVNDRIMGIAKHHIPGGEQDEDLAMLKTVAMVARLIETGDTEEERERRATKLLWVISVLAPEPAVELELDFHESELDSDYEDSDEDDDVQTTRKLRKRTKKDKVQDDTGRISETIEQAISEVFLPTGDYTLIPQSVKTRGDIEEGLYLLAKDENFVKLVTDNRIKASNYSVRVQKAMVVVKGLLDYKTLTTFRNRCIAAGRMVLLNAAQTSDEELNSAPTFVRLAITQNRAIEKMTAQHVLYWPLVYHNWAKMYDAYTKAKDSILKSDENKGRLESWVIRTVGHDGRFEARLKRAFFYAVYGISKDTPMDENVLVSREKEYDRIHERGSVLQAISEVLGGTGICLLLPDNFGTALRSASPTLVRAAVQHLVIQEPWVSQLGDLLSRDYLIPILTQRAVRENISRELGTLSVKQTKQLCWDQVAGWDGKQFQD